MNLLLFGPPGAGKGTIAKGITDECEMPHISTGNMLRAAAADGSELGDRIAAILQTGGLIDDASMIALVEARLSEPDARHGWLLDGYPRTLPQAKALDTLLEQMETPVDQVILVEVPDSTVIERLAGRRVCLSCGSTYHVDYAPPRQAGICDTCGQPKVVQRPDDTEETIRARLSTYRAQTAPVVDYYRAQGLVLRFPNDGAPDATIAAVLAALSRA